jgi:hypothetical protein
MKVLSVTVELIGWFGQPVSPGSTPTIIIAALLPGVAGGCGSLGVQRRHRPVFGHNAQRSLVAARREVLTAQLETALACLELTPIRVTP